MRDETFEKLIDLLLRTTKERDELREANAKLHQESWQAISYRNDALAECEAVVTEWEEKNGDVPRTTIKLADRIRVNAGLIENTPNGGE